MIRECKGCFHEVEDSDANCNTKGCLCICWRKKQNFLPLI